MPWDTVERLEAGDIVLHAMIWRADRPSGFPQRELPLSLDDAEHIGFEGQPDHIYTERIAVEVNGRNIDMLIFYGVGDRTAVPPVAVEPSAATRAAAQEQLARLLIPGTGDDGPAATSGNPTP